MAQLVITQYLYESRNSNGRFGCVIQFLYCRHEEGGFIKSWNFLGRHEHRIDGQRSINRKAATIMWKTEFHTV